MADVVLTKKLDARNGNNAAIGTDTFPNATIIAFQNAAAKSEVIDALCSAGNYDALDPATRPSKQNFANRELNFYLRELVRQYRHKQAFAAVVEPDVSDVA